VHDRWGEVPLGDLTKRVVEPVVLADEQSYTNLGVKWYGAGTFRREPKSGSDIKAERLYRVRPGQFVYNRLFATEGSFALIQPEDADAVASNEFPVFDLDDERLLPGYLRLHFQQPSVWHQVNQECIGTTKSRLRWKESLFAAHRVALPPLDEQHRIVNLIEALDSTIEGADSVLAVSETAHVRLREHSCMGSKPFLLGDLLVPIIEPVRVQSETVYQEIGIRSHGRGVFRKEGVSGAALANKKVFWMTPGALAFNIVFAWEGAVALLSDDVEGKIASHRFPNYRSHVPSGEVFLAQYFRTARGVQLLSDCSPGGAGRNRTLNRDRVMSSTVLLPPTGAWPDLVELLSDSEGRCEAARRSAACLRDLRSNLLTALLSGEHKIPESYDQLMRA